MLLFYQQEINVIQRQISFEEAKNKFKDRDVPLIETSALNDTNGESNTTA